MADAELDGEVAALGVEHVFEDDVEMEDDGLNGEGGVGGGAGSVEPAETRSDAQDEGPAEEKGGGESSGTPGLEAEEGKGELEGDGEKDQSAEGRASDAEDKKDDGDGEEDDGQDDEDDEDMVLYAKISHSASAVTGAVSDLMAQVLVNGPVAVSEILSLVVCASRPEGVLMKELVTPDMIIGNDPQQSVRDICELVRNDPAAKGGLVSKDAKSKKVRRAYEDFWRRLSAESSDAVLFDTDCFDTVISWLEAMSCASFRLLRFAACLAAYRLVDGFIDLGGRVRKQLASLQKQLATERKRCGITDDAPSKTSKGRRKAQAKGAKTLSKRGKELTKKVDDLTANNSELLELSTKVYTLIFVLKYRDIAADIRAISVSSLGAWIVSYPDHYLDDKHNKYIGWLLSDKDPSVRKASLDVLLKMLSNKDFFPSLELFLRRFVGRIVEMTKDRDDAVAVAAIRLATVLIDFDVLDETSCDIVCDLTTEENQADIRRAAGEFMALLVRAEDLDASENGSASKRGSGGKGMVGKLTKGKTKKKPGRPPVRGPVLDDVPDFERARDELREFLFTVTRIGDTVCDERVVVDAVWDHIPALRSWEAFAALLVEDNSADEMRDMDGNRRSSRHSSSGPDLSALEDEVEPLSDVDKRVLCELLVASAREASGKGDKIRAKTLTRIEADGYDTPSELLTVQFASSLPKLLSSFQADPRALAALVQLPQYFAVSHFKLAGQEQHYKALLTRLVDITERHTGSPAVMAACSATFRMLLADGNPLRQQTKAAMQKAGVSASKSLSSLVRTGLEQAPAVSLAAATSRLRVVSQLVEVSRATFEDITAVLRARTEGVDSLASAHDMVGDACRAAVGFLAWSALKVRASIPSLSEESAASFADLEESADFLRDRENIIALLVKLSSSDNPSIRLRSLTLQNILAVLTLSAGLSRALNDHLKEIINDKDSSGAVYAPENALNIHDDTNAVAEAVKSSFMAVLASDLETGDDEPMSRTECRTVEGKRIAVFLSEPELRDCASSVIQACFLRTLPTSLLHLPLLTLLCRRRRGTASTEGPTTYDISRLYHQQLHKREKEAVQFELNALVSASEFDKFEAGSDGEDFPSVRTLGTIIAQRYAFSKATSGSGLSKLLDLVVSYGVDAVPCDEDVHGRRRRIAVMCSAGLALIPRLPAQKAKDLHEEIIKKAPATADVVEAAAEEANVSSCYDTFCKALLSLGNNEAPVLQVISQRRKRGRPRKGVAGPAIGKRVKNEKPRKNKARVPKPPVDMSKVRRSSRSQKAVDYAAIENSDDLEESEVDDDDDDSASDSSASEHEEEQQGILAAEDSILRREKEGMVNTTRKIQDDTSVDAGLGEGGDDVSDASGDELESPEAESPEKMGSPPRRKSMRGKKHATGLTLNSPTHRKRSSRSRVSPALSRSQSLSDTVERHSELVASPPRTPRRTSRSKKALPGTKGIASQPCEDDGTGQDCETPLNRRQARTKLPQGAGPVVRSPTHHRSSRSTAKSVPPSQKDSPTPVRRSGRLSQGSDEPVSTSLPASRNSKKRPSSESQSSVPLANKENISDDPIRVSPRNVDKASLPSVIHRKKQRRW